MLQNHDDELMRPSPPTRTPGPSRRHGFSLIELIVAIAIIGIIAAILIPNLLDAVHKAKQRRSVSDMRSIGVAWMSWATDQVSAAAAGAHVQNLDWGEDLPIELSADELAALLQGDENATYLENMPTRDGWGHPLDFAAVVDIEDPSTYSELITDSRAVGIRSPGRDGLVDNGGVYEAAVFPARRYDNDIVWLDGYFVRVPGGTSRSAGGS